MSLENKVNKTVRDLFSMASDQVTVALIDRRKNGHLKVTDDELNDITKIVKQTLDSAFLRCCPLIDKILK